MKKSTLLALCLFSFIFSNNVFAQESNDEQIDKAVATALETMVNITPESSLLLFAQPDAFIGKVLPSIPPHFAAGLNFSGTIINTTDITNAANLMLDAINTKLFNPSDYIPEWINGFISLPELTLPEKLPLPTAAVSARIGGFVIPFDIGLIGVATIPNVLDSITLDTYNLNYNFMTLGADVRFALYEGGLIMPKISLGVGYIFTNQGWNFNVSKSNVPSQYTETDSTIVTGTTDSTANMDLQFKTHTFFTQVQVSKKILFMTPYAGIRVRFILSESNYNWKYKTEFYADNDISSTPSKKTDGEGTGSKNVALSDFAWTPECINPTLFGGLGLKFGFFDLGLNVSWNMATNYFTFGILTGFKM